jgi:excinuclease ABC subunit C
LEPSVQFPQKVREKVAALPSQPGCYLMRDRRGKIVYVGKAADLKRRVGSYFRDATWRHADPKLRGLLRSVADLDILPLATEAQALLTESRLIKDYRPRYNVLLKDDKRFLLIKLRAGERFPRFEAVRLKKDDGARYWGPYASTAVARACLEFLSTHYGIRRCRVREPDAETHRHCLDDVVRHCAAPCTGACGEAAYAARVAEACAFLDGERGDALDGLRAQMERAAAERRFEKAAALRDFYLLLRKARRDRAQVARPPALRAADEARGLAMLQEALGMDRPPRVIECYDISNISGTHSVASRVVSVDGQPTPSRYRMFRIRTVEGADDPASMAEVIRRRFSGTLAARDGLPDLVLVDGGITQLRAARAELDALGLGHVRAAGIAKQYEELVHDPANEREPVRFPAGSPALHVLQRIRDEAHRFALTYHRKLRARVIRESVLDEIEGVGPAHKRSLLRHFGSLARIRKASAEELAEAPGIGETRAAAVFAALHPAAP